MPALEEVPSAAGLESSVAREEHAGLLLSDRGAELPYFQGRRTSVRSRVKAVAVGVASALLLLAACSASPRSSVPLSPRPSAAGRYELKAELAGAGGEAQERRKDDDLGGGSALLMSAIDHLLSPPDEVRHRREEERKEAEEKEKAKKLALEKKAREEKRVAAKRAAEKAAREKRLEAERRQRELKRRQKEEEEAERKALQEQEREREARERARRQEAFERAREKAARERAERLRRQREEEAKARAKAKAEARRKCLEEKKKTDAFRPTLYCLSLMMPFGYEPSLLAEQEQRGVGIFACDKYAVFSNTTTVLTTGRPAPVKVTLMNGSLAVVYGGRWGTAMNTGVFNRFWTEVITIGDYRYYDWTVKVDPDAVFFPERLRNVLRRRMPLNSVKVRGLVPEKVDCGKCKLPGHDDETCAEHVQARQQQGMSCAAALNATARAPPEDCGCACDDFACDDPQDTAMYINNCKWGLHGPIEVFSRRAVASYLAGLPQCVNLLTREWGEDKFIDQCMQGLGIARENEYDILTETACGEQPSPCGSSNVAFHPFKSIESYFTCYGYASKYGKGPEDLECDGRPKLDHTEHAVM